MTLTDPQRRLLRYLAYWPSEWVTMHHLDFHEGSLVPLDAVVLVPSLVEAGLIEHDADRGVRLTATGMSAVFA